MRHLILILALFTTIVSFSQTSFEVITTRTYPQPGSAFKINADSIRARINAIPDSATFTPTLVYTVANTAVIDSLEFTLTGSNTTQVYQVKSAVSALLSAGLLRITPKTFYLSPGSFPYLKRFTATARATDNTGARSTLSSFSKD
jgi:hypothetical protein